MVTGGVTVTTGVRRLRDTAGGPGTLGAGPDAEPNEGAAAGDDEDEGEAEGDARATPATDTGLRGLDCGRGVSVGVRDGPVVLGSFAVRSVRPRPATSGPVSGAVGVCSCSAAVVDASGAGSGAGTSTVVGANGAAEEGLVEARTQVEDEGFEAEDVAEWAAAMAVKRRCESSRSVAEIAVAKGAGDRARDAAGEGDG